MKKLIIENINLDELRNLIQDAFQVAINSGKPEEEFLNIQEASAFTKIPTKPQTLTFLSLHIQFLI